MKRSVLHSAYVSAMCAVLALGSGARTAHAQQATDAADAGSMTSPSLTGTGSPTGPAAAGAVNNPPAVSATANMREYKIGADDVLTITVWHEPDLSRSAPVRPDGMISLPLVGEITAAGKTTSELEAELRTALQRFIKSPEIYVVISQIRSRHINIIGEVQHPGTFTLMQSMGVLDAIAGAGGLRDFAKKNKIYVLREEADGRRLRMPYAYADVLKGKTNAKEIALQPNDTVVVP